MQSIAFTGLGDEGEHGDFAHALGQLIVDPSRVFEGEYNGPAK
jgi:hypothetical protein